MPAITDLRDHRSPEPLWLSSWEFPIGYAHKFSTADVHGSLLPPRTPSRSQMWLPDPPSSCRCHHLYSTLVITGDRARVCSPLATTTVASLCYDWHCTVHWAFSFFQHFPRREGLLIFSDCLPQPVSPLHLNAPPFQSYLDLGHKHTRSRPLSNNRILLDKFK